jgi:hypothetical protein
VHHGLLAPHGMPRLGSWLLGKSQPASMQDGSRRRPSPPEGKPSPCWRWQKILNHHDRVTTDKMNCLFSPQVVIPWMRGWKRAEPRSPYVRSHELVRSSVSGGREDVIHQMSSRSTRRQGTPGMRWMCFASGLHLIFFRGEAWPAATSLARRPPCRCAHQPQSHGGGARPSALNRVAAANGPSPGGSRGRQATRAGGPSIGAPEVETTRRGRVSRSRRRKARPARRRHPPSERR